MVRYKPSQFTKKELETIVTVLATDQGIDFLTGGKLNKYKRKAAIAAYRAIVRPAATAGAITVGRLAGTALGVGKQIALRHPVLTAGAVVYYTYKNRDEIADLVEQGYEIIQPAVQPITKPIGQGISEVLDITRPGRQELGETMMPSRPITGKLFPERAKRKPSSFNKAVAAGIKQVKASTSYGKKGVINSPRKAFSAVTKVISKVKKGKKAPTKGILGKVAREARKRFRRSLFRRR